MKALKSRLFGLVLVLAAAALTGCGENRNTTPQTDAANGSEDSMESTDLRMEENDAAGVNDDTESGGSVKSGNEEAGDDPETTELTVRFGDDGEPFTLHLYDNETAAAIARHVGTADWRLPIYNYEGYENWEVMQYYDVPSRYEIPSDPETVTAEAAGTVYYSEPNRIVLFYGDAEVSGEYTPVGYFDDTEEFRSAVENNPVLEGWDTKMVNISR